ncbi:MAG TPA: cysteine hydrolase [Phycisphaerales bacterium]|nr:cysteine hydrolase [Phycisphaerales bacterium]
MDAQNNYNYDRLRMIRPILNLRKKRILIDVDTQRDFFLADGQMCIRNHRRVLANIRRVMAWARREHIRVISTALIHPPNDHHEPYCRIGTEGVRKLRYTLRYRHVVFDADDNTDLPRDNMQDVEQIVLYKRTLDPFDEPRAERILTETKANELIVIGGPSETSVLSTVLGLLVRQKNVIVVYDAIGSLDKNAAQVALRKMQAKGAKLLETRSLFGVSSLKIVHACTCDRCRGKLPAVAKNHSR